jgi:hypothetical protein
VKALRLVQRLADVVVEVGVRHHQLRERNEIVASCQDRALTLQKRQPTGELPRALLNFVKRSLP